jgi:2',3'-cyclic-nucleotide 2'-phosphodiesterase (5'-nucleotidase family)
MMPLFSFVAAVGMACLLLQGKVVLVLADDFVNITENFVLQILSLNDHHSHLSEKTLMIPLENLDAEVTANINKTAIPEVQVPYAGFARIVQLFDDLQERSGPEVDAHLRLHAGDAFSGTLFFALHEGMNV